MQTALGDRDKALGIYQKQLEIALHIRNAEEEATARTNIERCLLQPSSEIHASVSSLNTAATAF